MNRYETKIARMAAGTDTRADFILADAKDADMAAGISAMGRNRTMGGLSPYRGRDEYLDDIRAMLELDVVDIMLVSASTLETLVHEGAFNNSRVQPAIRANDTTDLWRGRGSPYTTQRSVPFRSASLAGAQTRLGLYSMTFNGNAEHDAHALECFRRFREDAREHGFSYFLEVFNPNEGRIAQPDRGVFLNDMIIRALAGLRQAERPEFLKIPFNGATALTELCAFDPRMVVGIMGGGSGTTRDCLELLHQAQSCGARAALFGRKIVDADDPLLLVQAMRHVTDGNLPPDEATCFYHDALARKGRRAERPLGADRCITDGVLLDGPVSMGIMG
ncbi:hypothetical protein B0W47_16000 [Komagataeibacter nataicola]|uniref:Fructose-bisphosphate aldolase n=1 Tax=Komagataeibacter nataicola TaxID=265960 RepID=A0A9N7CBA6_9PROT|nr:hypothetical protein [Komagataeibacter nataicola]AQU88693.1 hypothetical protein B0W47_16000 [Komagataeibacter nataicola]PYD66692.1 hypothetical protein CDI09_07120 [Komagataeibacter nataicola]WEQ57057.1 hypothetical protein LV564_08380 [Komagataeibacter nataicola]WNM08589.1 hypothetical protein RI056_17485 [Komagataeibacter nataicola]GBR26181.1 hypothetical protein AA0616_3151 [Komagataeibacter nataicola NRIC 0616]